MGVPPGDREGDPLADTTLESELAWRGQFLTVYRDRVRSADGHVGIREYVRHPGAVMVIPLTDDDRVVLERQYRHPLARTFVEFPAGKIDPGESLQRCAERELLEETGYRAARWDHLGGFHNAIGYSDERIDVYLARDLTQVGTAGEAGEVLQVFTWQRSELLPRAHAGEITDVKTLIGIYWLQEFLSNDHGLGRVRPPAGSTPVEPKPGG
jgi:ADP-ribose pyrophosphatase